MTDTKYDLAEAQLLLGREAARHGDWSSERHAAAAELFRELASLDKAGLKTVAVHVGIGAHLVDPHWLRFDFEGGVRVVVTYEHGRFTASDPAGKRPSLDIELEYNAYSQRFETHESDPAHAGSRRSATTLIVRKAIQHLHSA
jgi:hypothetical protein